MITLAAAEAADVTGGDNGVWSSPIVRAALVSAGVLLIVTAIGLVVRMVSWLVEARVDPAVRMTLAVNEMLSRQAGRWNDRYTESRVEIALLRRDIEQLQRRRPGHRP